MLGVRGPLAVVAGAGISREPIIFGTIRRLIVFVVGRPGGLAFSADAKFCPDVLGDQRHRPFNPPRLRCHHRLASISSSNVGASFGQASSQASSRSGSSMPTTYQKASMVDCAVR